MSILVDRALRAELKSGELRVETGPGQRLTGDEAPGGAIQPSSIDLGLGPTLLRLCQPRTAPYRAIDPEHECETAVEPWRSDRFDNDRLFYVLYPGRLRLAATAEWIGVGRNLVARIEGKSSLARLGLFIHISAGYVDPGFKGNVTLELVNAGGSPLILRPGMPIAQLVVYRATGPASVAYGDADSGSHYQFSTGPRAAAPVGARPGYARTLATRYGGADGHDPARNT